MKKLKYFSASWCGPCRTFKPIIQEIASEGYDVEILDIDTYKTEAQLYGIRSVPVTIIEEDGKEIGRFVGTQPKSTIINVLK